MVSGHFTIQFEGEKGPLQSKGKLCKYLDEENMKPNTNQSSSANWNFDDDLMVST